MSGYHRIIKLGLLLGLATASFNLAQAQQFYKWQDEKGATHYSQTPPPARYSKALSIKERPAAPTTAAVPAATDNAKPAAPTAKPTKPAAPAVQKLSAEACKDLKSNLDLLQSGRRLYQNDSGGERSYLTEAQKSAQIQTYTQNIAQGCG